MPNEISATATVEEYLETILNMNSEQKPALGARLAERLQVSPPTVTATLKRMRRDGLVTSGDNEGIQLTEKGMKIAVSIVRRHRVAERFLMDLLRIPWHETHEEACQLEHAMSERVVERLFEVLGKPAICPHGNPIPVNGILPPFRGSPLDTAAPGYTFVIERISEEANRSKEMMDYFGRNGLEPGTTISVSEVANYAGTMSIFVNKTNLSLGIKAAALIWVIPK